MPSLPGVYWFLDANDKVLYVGKAKNLKNRVRQYASLKDTRPQIGTLVALSKKINWIPQESELQALLVEAALIKKYQPEYNILLKDDKSNLYIAISRDKFPKVVTLRKPELLRLSRKVISYGPYQSAYKVRQVLEIARGIFKWCERPLAYQQYQEIKQPPKPCFYTHLGLCCGACTGLVSQSEYGEMVNHLRAFLNGKSFSLIQSLKQEIETAVAKKDFERAGYLRDQIKAITEVTAKEYRLKPDLTLPVLTSNLEQEAIFSLRSLIASYYPLPRTAKLARIEGYDISNIAGTSATASMVVALDGRMSHPQYRHFGIKTLTTPNDFAMLKETLTRRQQHPEWGQPDAILIDGGKGQLRSVLSVWKWPGVVVSIAKDPDRLIIPIVSVAKFSKAKIKYHEIILDRDLPATRLLQQIRDESHRFSRRLHHIKRDKKMFS